MKLHALTTILLSTTVVVATTLRGAILPSPHLANPSLLPPDTTLTLITSHAIHRTLLRADNTFVFRNLSAGSYLLETISSTHHFAPYRVDVSTHPSSISVSQTFRGNAWDNTGERLGALEVRAIGKKEYFIVREGFSPLKMLGSPMILIAIVSLASIIVLPKMLDKSEFLLTLLLSLLPLLLLLRQNELLTNGFQWIPSSRPSSRRSPGSAELSVPGPRIRSTSTSRAFWPEPVAEVRLHRRVGGLLGRRGRGDDAHDDDTTVEGVLVGWLGGGDGTAICDLYFDLEWIGECIEDTYISLFWTLDLARRFLSGRTHLCMRT